jgi:hypothetical protein
MRHRQPGPLGQGGQVHVQRLLPWRSRRDGERLQQVHRLALPDGREDLVLAGGHRDGKRPVRLDIRVIVGVRLHVAQRDLLDGIGRAVEHEPTAEGHLRSRLAARHAGWAGGHPRAARCSILRAGIRAARCALARAGGAVVHLHLDRHPRRRQRRGGHIPMPLPRHGRPGERIRAVDGDGRLRDHPREAAMASCFPSHVLWMPYAWRNCWKYQTPKKLVPPLYTTGTRRHNCDPT